MPLGAVHLTILSLSPTPPIVTPSYTPSASFTPTPTLTPSFTPSATPSISLFVSVNNIADVAYQSHLSRLKYAPANYATGRIGVYNMGRNGSFKIRIPINIK